MLGGAGEISDRVRSLAIRRLFRNRKRWVAAAVVCAALIEFGPLITSPLVDDDYLLFSIFQHHGWWQAMITGGGADNVIFRPLSDLFVGLLHAIFGLAPAGYHVVALAMILADGYLTAKVAERLGVTPSAAFFAGAFVALDGIWGVPVRWASALSSPMMVLFVLGAIIVSLRHPQRLRDRLLATALFTAGLLSRETAAVLPVLVMVLVAQATPAPVTKRLQVGAVRAAPMLIVLLAYLAWRHSVGFVGGANGPYQQSLGGHGASNGLALLLYGLDFLDRSSMAIASGLLTAIVLVALAARTAPRSLHIAVGLGWFVVGILPVVFLSRHAMDPYYVDLALPGLAIALAGAVELMVPQIRRRFVGYCAALLLLLGVVAGGQAARAGDGWLTADAARSAPIVTTVEHLHPKAGSTIVLTTAKPCNPSLLTSIVQVVKRDPSLHVVVRCT